MRIVLATLVEIHKYRKHSAYELRWFAAAWSGPVELTLSLKAQVTPNRYAELEGNLRWRVRSRLEETPCPIYNEPVTRPWPAAAYMELQVHVDVFVTPVLLGQLLIVKSCFLLCFRCFQIALKGPFQSNFSQPPDVLTTRSVSILCIPCPIMILDSPFPLLFPHHPPIRTHAEPEVMPLIGAIAELAVAIDAHELSP